MYNGQFAKLSSAAGLGFSVGGAAVGDGPASVDGAWLGASVEPVPDVPHATRNAAKPASL